MVETWKNGKAKVGSRQLNYIMEGITEAMMLSLDGKIIGKRRRTPRSETDAFLGPGEAVDQKKSGSERVATLIIKYITLDERFTWLYGNHFGMLSHFR